MLELLTLEASTRLAKASLGIHQTLFDDFILSRITLGCLHIQAFILRHQAQAERVSLGESRKCGLTSTPTRLRLILEHHFL
jgi:hypothetical protein